MGISNINVFSKTGSSSNSCAEKAMSQCTKKHKKYVVLHGLSYTCSSQTARHNFLPSNCLLSSTDTELMSEWLSTSPCYSMPWIRLPKLQCQAKHLQLISFAWNGIRREKRNWGCSRNHFVYMRESFSNPGGNSGRKSLLPVLWLFMLEQSAPPQPQNRTPHRVPALWHCPATRNCRMQQVIPRNMDPSFSESSATTLTLLLAPASATPWSPASSILPPHSLLCPGPSASTSSAHLSMAGALLALPAGTHGPSARLILRLCSSVKV